MTSSEIVISASEISDVALSPLVQPFEYEPLDNMMQDVDELEEMSPSQHCTADSVIPSRSDNPQPGQETVLCSEVDGLEWPKFAPPGLFFSASDRAGEMDGTAAQDMARATFSFQEQQVSGNANFSGDISLFTASSEGSGQIGPVLVPKKRNFAVTAGNDDDACKVNEGGGDTQHKEKRPRVATPAFSRPSEVRTVSDKLPAAIPTSKDSAASNIATSRQSSRITRTVTTNFAHPMVFNSSTNECAFCIAPDIQLAGFGRKNPEVIDFTELSGWAEISGGHREEDTLNTRLCGPCTTTRVGILMCDSHNMVELPGMQLSEKDHAEAQARLHDEDVPNVGKHCHVCLQLSSYECRTADSEGEESSCELMLCKTCALRLTREHGGSLPSLLADMSARHEECRADAELLNADGPLVKYQRWQAQYIDD